MSKSTGNTIPIRVGVPSYIYADVIAYKNRHLYAEENDVIRKILYDFIQFEDSIPTEAYLFLNDTLIHSRVYVSPELFRDLTKMLRANNNLRNEKYMVNVAINLFFIIHKQKKVC